MASCITLVFATWVLASCGQREVPQPTPVRETPCSLAHVEAPSKKALWAFLLAGAERPEPDRLRIEGVDGTDTVIVSTPIRRPGDMAGHDHLEGIEFPEGGEVAEVRCYVAHVLKAARVSRLSFGSMDPEVELLAHVGDENTEVLVEALVHAELEGEEFYIVHALKRSVGDDHKAMILDALERAPDLVAVVVDKGWTEEAAPVLLRALKARSTYMPPDWVTAAAQVAGAENYDDLRFQLAEGQDPAGVWMAIRNLPGMEPLDEFVDRTWRNATEKEYLYRWYELAVVAAHYGHVDALEPFARRLPETRRWLGLFQSLTGFGHGRTDSWLYADAQEWLATHKDDLAFDRAEQRYHLKVK